MLPGNLVRRLPAPRCNHAPRALRPNHPDPKQALPAYPVLLICSELSHALPPDVGPAQRAAACRDWASLM
jgi:hypothetical protein